MALKERAAKEKTKFSALLSNLPKEFQVFERVEALRLKGKHSEAESILQRNRPWLDRLNKAAETLKFDDRSIRRQKIYDGEMQTLRSQLESHLKKTKPFNKSTIQGIIPLEDNVIVSLLHWGFTRKEIRLLLMIKHGEIT
ncbi:MAG: hypothetical protein KKC75_00970 [Nanoarchaeota archaeon]|nr:hypothetical protein [Nanoarchaeota archaeon]MBU1004512.1 hypothetical protein [Nanoarchaeota archaeon]MBU1946654.1 hypothetical protein [Nanoarchaeota archaeon]